jgi:hypothetical protein
MARDEKTAVVMFESIQAERSTLLFHLIIPPRNPRYL